jgi:hypothetical protein
MYLVENYPREGESAAGAVAQAEEARFGTHLEHIASQPVRGLRDRSSGPWGLAAGRNGFGPAASRGMNRFC